VNAEPETVDEEMTPDQRDKFIGELEQRMREAARKFEFEKAAQLRDRIRQLRTKDVAGIGIPA
jgi:excinuclease ABC subunit B